MYVQCKYSLLKVSGQAVNNNTSVVNHISYLLLIMHTACHVVSYYSLQVSVALTGSVKC